MAEKLLRVIGKDHSPGHAGIRLTPPQLAFDEVGEAPEEYSDRSDRGRDVAKRQDGDIVLERKQHHRGDAAEKAAMEGHAAFPQFENGGRMLDEEGKVVEQHIAGTAAEDDAEGDPENEIVELHGCDRRRPVPQFLVSDQRARIYPSDHDAADISQRIPSDRERSDRDGDGINCRKGDGEKGHLALTSTTRGCGGRAPAAAPNAVRPHRGGRPAASGTQNRDGCRGRSRPRCSIPSSRPLPCR